MSLWPETALEARDLVAHEPAYINLWIDNDRLYADTEQGVQLLWEPIDYEEEAARWAGGY